MNPPLFPSSIANMKTRRELQSLRREARRSLYAWRITQVCAVLCCLVVLGTLFYRHFPEQVEMILTEVKRWKN